MELDPGKARPVGWAAVLTAAFVLIAPTGADARLGSSGTAKADETPPSLLIFGNSGPYQTRNQQPSVEFYASDVDGGESGAGIDRIEATVDDGAPTALPATATQFQPPSPLPDGDHSIVIRAFDNAGNNAADGVSFTVDTTPTPVADLAPSDNTVLTDTPVTFYAGNSHDTDVDGRIVRFEWDLDGDGTFETDTGTDSETTRTYPDPAGLAVSVRVTNDSGATATALVLLDVRPKPPEGGQVGVSINDGAVATNDPHVTLTLVWPEFANTVVVSNDGGFRTAGSTMTFDIKPQIPWTLRSAGAKRAPRLVYVRFQGAGSDDQPYQDDIILDKRKPLVDDAALATSGHKFSVDLDATDDNSGVAVAEFYAKRNGKPIDSVKFKPHHNHFERNLSQPVPVTSRRAPKFVRVEDAAGNDSRLAEIHDKHRNL